MKQADIVLLDDILSALDVHTSRWIVDNCLSGDLLVGRTVILVTHHVAMVAPLAQHVVTIAADGTITSQATVGEAIRKDSTLLGRVIEEEEEEVIIDKVEDVVTGDNAPMPLEEVNKVNGQLIAQEEVDLGHVSVSARKLHS